MGNITLPPDMSFLSPASFSTVQYSIVQGQSTPLLHHFWYCIDKGKYSLNFLLSKNCWKSIPVFCLPEEAKGRKTKLAAS